MEIAPQQVNLNLFRQERPLAVKPKQDGHSTENESVKIPIISLLTCARTRALQEFLCFCCHKCHTLHHTYLILRLLSQLFNIYLGFIGRQRGNEYKNNTLFEVKQHVVFDKTTRRFPQNNLWGMMTLVTAKNAKPLYWERMLRARYTRERETGTHTFRSYR